MSEKEKIDSTSIETFEQGIEEQDFVHFPFRFLPIPIIHAPIEINPSQWPGDGRRERDRYRRRAPFRCCVYRNTITGRLRSICQEQGRRCSRRLDGQWSFLREYPVFNCNQCF